MSDYEHIVTALSSIGATHPHYFGVFGDAIDTIESLTSENTRLREELELCRASHIRLERLYNQALGKLGLPPFEQILASNTPPPSHKGEDLMKWISVEERLPQKIGAFLVLRKENKFPTSRLYNGNGEWSSKGTVTHWMPLPPAPEEKIE